jgi:DNA polymerase-3 subunit beta
MKFTCTKENLISALNIVAPLTGRGANLPILGNILIVAEDSRVELTATNLEVAVKATLRAKTDEHGLFSVPAKTVFEFVSLLPDGQVDISLDNNELLIVSGTSRTKIKGNPADEYPVIPAIEEKSGYTVRADAFRDAVAKTVIAVAKNEIRPELSGLYLGFFTDRYDGLVLAATDSYRLAEYRLPVDQGKDDMRCIIPSRTAFELIRLIGLSVTADGEHMVRISLGENQFAVRYGGFEMISRLIDGKYPDYAQIIPAAFKTTARFTIEPMVKRIKAAGLFAASGVNAVSFDLNAGEKTVAVSSTNTQTGEHSSVLEADVDGVENSILLNHRYVLEGLQHMEGATASLKMNGGDTPCLFSDEEHSEYVYIVMPIRQ